MAVFTATLLTFLVFLRWQRKRDLRKFMYTASWTAVTHPPASGKGYIQQLQAKMDELGVGEIACCYPDVITQWTVTTAGIVLSLLTTHLPRARVLREPTQLRLYRHSYDDGKTDEFVLPTVIEKDGKPVAVVSDKDSVVFFNFRPDRAREITRAFCDDEFDRLCKRETP